MVPSGSLSFVEKSFHLCSVRSSSVRFDCSKRSIRLNNIWASELFTRYSRAQTINVKSVRDINCSLLFFLSPDESKRIKETKSSVHYESCERPAIVEIIPVRMAKILYNFLSFLFFHSYLFTTVFIAIKFPQQYAQSSGFSLKMRCVWNVNINNGHHHWQRMNWSRFCGSCFIYEWANNFFFGCTINKHWHWII